MLRALLPPFVKALLKNVHTFYYGYGYRTFGQNSIIKSPMQIIGKKLFP